MDRLLRSLFGFVVMVGLALGPVGAAVAQDTIKIAFIGPFSGAFAPQGDAFRKSCDTPWMSSTRSGGALGKQFEIVTFDDKLQPAEAIIALKSVVDQNIPIVIQCVGSNVAAAMIDGGGEE